MRKTTLFAFAPALIAIGAMRRSARRRVAASTRRRTSPRSSSGKAQCRPGSSHRCGAIRSDGCPGISSPASCWPRFRFRGSWRPPARWHAARDRTLRLCRRIACVRRLRGQPLHVGRGGLHHRADLRRRARFDGRRGHGALFRAGDAARPHGRWAFSRASPSTSSWAISRHCSAGRNGDRKERCEPAGAEHAMLDPGEWLLRMAGHARGQAALLFHSPRRRSHHHCRAVGHMARQAGWLQK
jgi:hypothetical protein